MTRYSKYNRTLNFENFFQTSLLSDVFCQTSRGVGGLGAAERERESERDKRELGAADKRDSDGIVHEKSLPRASMGGRDRRQEGDDLRTVGKDERRTFGDNGGHEVSVCVVTAGMMCLCVLCMLLVVSNFPLIVLDYCCSLIILYYRYLGKRPSGTILLPLVVTGRWERHLALSRDAISAWR